jgi:hypothetical protein
MKLSTACLIAFAAWLGPAAFSQEEPVVTFGTTVVIPSGLSGAVYHIPRNTSKLPDFKKLKPEGTIYTTSLNVPLRKFDLGFPGVTKRFEWFAIDYTGKFWIQKPGLYRFTLTSDDGAQLYIDDELVANNDGIHSAETVETSVELAGGIHRLRVPYFQGPRFEVALILRIAGPDEELRVFSTDEFKPPPNPATWTFSADEPGKL